MVEARSKRKLSASLNFEEPSKKRQKLHHTSAVETLVNVNIEEQKQKQANG
jgi:hypothetical protein